MIINIHCQQWEGPNQCNAFLGWNVITFIEEILKVESIVHRYNVSFAECIICVINKTVQASITTSSIINTCPLNGWDVIRHCTNERVENVAWIPECKCVTRFDFISGLLSYKRDVLLTWVSETARYILIVQHWSPSLKLCHIQQQQGQWNQVNQIHQWTMSFPCNMEDLMGVAT